MVPDLFLCSVDNDSGAQHIFTAQINLLTWLSCSKAGVPNMVPVGDIVPTDIFLGGCNEFLGMSSQEQLPSPPPWVTPGPSRG